MIVSPQLPGAIPFIVGVTGHRDLLAEDVPRLREFVRKELRRLREQLPDTPLVLLSPLVGGADQLVAEVAIEPGIEASLLAILPWPREFAPDQLARGGDAATFERWLARASDVVAMPLEEHSQQRSATDWNAFAEGQYDLVGRYIARHSQLLIALWDGESPATSGTAKVVAWQRDGAPAPFAAALGELDTVEGAPTCHIVCRRESGGDADKTKGSLPTVRYVQARAEDSMASGDPRAIQPAWSRIDRFNHDVAALRRTSPERFATSRSWVLAADAADRLPRNLRELFEYYSLADAVALTFQQRLQPLVWSLFSIGIAAIACLEIYAHLWHHWFVLVGYLSLLGGGYWLFARARREEWEGRYLDYRAFAEALRVQLFWRWSGLSDCAADYYLRHLRGELGWVRQAARSCFLLTHETPVGLDESNSRFTIGSDESLRAVRIHWVEDQRKYFSKTEPKKEHGEARCERIAKWSFRGALAVAGGELVYHLAYGHENHALILLTFFCLVAAAVAEEIADYHNYGILARQYAWMKNLFTTARAKLDQYLATGDVAAARRLLHELGLEALNENADWLVQRRRQPIQPPKG